MIKQVPNELMQAAEARAHGNFRSHGLGSWYILFIAGDNSM